MRTGPAHSGGGGLGGPRHQGVRCAALLRRLLPHPALELLDPYRFTRGVKVRGKRDLEDVMVRRLKDDIREIQGGFPNRNVKRLSIDGLPPDAPELQLSRLLDEYRTAREQRHAQASNKAKAAAGLLVVGLQQRLLSSIEAFARSLKAAPKSSRTSPNAAAINSTGTWSASRSGFGSSTKSAPSGWSRWGWCIFGRKPTEAEIQCGGGRNPSAACCQIVRQISRQIKLITLDFQIYFSRLVCQISCQIIGQESAVGAVQV